jgi:hypothetical protein
MKGKINVMFLKQYSVLSTRLVFSTSLKIPKAEHDSRVAYWPQQPIQSHNPGNWADHLPLIRKGRILPSEGFSMYACIAFVYVRR